MKSFDALKKLIADAEKDIAKADKGESAGGTRVRQVMQQVKKAAHEVRKEVIEIRTGKESAKAADAETPSFRVQVISNA